jgi:septum formation protein
VITAVCIVTAEDCIQEQVVSRVVFREITDGEIEEYWNTGEPRDKAGAYAIQGIGAKFVSSLEGSLTNVIGLPMEKVRDMLQSVSVSAGL